MPFYEEDVEITIKSMSSDKEPGLDGFTSTFFKEC
jgi:hypothetical protein